MSKPRPRPDVSPRSITSRDLDSFSRWSELLADHPPAAAIWRHADLDAPGSFQKALQMEWVVRLPTVAEGLLAKMYRLSRMLDSPDSAAHGFSDAFWKAGVFPNHPRVCALLSKKFPEHPGQLQLERLDKPAVDAMSENAEVHMQNLEPWIMLLIDLMAFREQALRLILDLSSTVITLLPHQNSLILHAFMDLFCSFVRVNLFSNKIPRKMLVQVYNLLHSMLRSGRDFDIYNRLVQFIDSYDPPLKGLQEDLNFVSPRIGEVLEAVGPIIFLSTDTRKLRNEGFLSPFHPRYPDILTNSAHPLRAQDLANVTSYREWILFGYLVCPEELLRVTSIDISMVVLKENLILTLFRDEYILLHEEYQLHVLPRILESKKLAKSGRTKLKEADLEYNVAKQVEKMISEVHDQALLSCGAIHFERRVLLKQEIGRMVLFFADQPSLLAPNIQMVFSALALTQYEIIWFFQHAGVASSRNKSVAVGIDASDSTVGFLLNGMDRLISLVRKYIAAIRGYALSYLLSCAGRIRFLLGTPGMVALDLDSTLKNLFHKVVSSLESIPKPHAENASTVTCNLSDLRKHWLSILMIVTSSRSSINIRHLEKATVSTGKEGLLSEGNMAFSWSRCVDELECQVSKHGSLKKLYFYHNHLTAVFRNTMFGPEGRPQHCLAWLGVASSFADCASVAFPEELNKIGRDAVLYVESLIESIMGGLEGLINILDSEGGFGPLEMQLRPEQVMGYAAHLNRTSTPLKSFKGAQNLPLPGHESYPGSNASIKMLEAAVQRLTNLCSVLNELEPICILNHVFVLREYMRECILGNFKKRLFAVLRIESYLQRPSVMESLLRRHVSIIFLAEQHVSMDLTEGVREILLSEAFSGPMHSLQTFDKINELTTGSAIEIISNWYIEYIVKDKSNAGILFAPINKCFKSPKVFGGNSAESFTTTEELKSIARIFGGYGLDRFDRVLRDYVASLLSCINTSLRSNHEALEAIAGSLNSCDRIEREANLKQILDMDTVLGFCLQIGQAVAFHHILVEAARAVLEEKACLITSLLSGVIKQLPDEIPEKDEIRRLRRVASSVGVSERHDSEWMYSIMKDVVCCSDSSWSLLPYLCSAFMDSSIWNTATYDVSTGGFSNSIYCLTRFINAAIPGGEFVRSEKAEEQRQPLSNGHSNDTVEQELQGRGWIEANIKASMELYVKCSALVLFESCNDNNRCNIVPKLIFLDRLCDLSPYIPRSMLEVHIPYALLRSIYRQLHSNSPSMAIELFLPSPRQSPLVPLGHSPAVRFNQGESTLQPGPHESAYRREPLYDVDGGTGHRSDEKHSRNARRSGPLEYTASRKAKFTESSSSVGRGLSPMRRFVSSRSGPLSFK